MLKRDTLIQEQHKPIRSFVERQGRQTERHEELLNTLWPIFGLSLQDSANFAEVFGRSAPVTLEIGFGNGEALLAAAAANPDQDFIGIEVYKVGIAQLLGGIAESGLQNIRIYCADAIEVLTNCMPDSSLYRLHLFFPDPWPKARHHKRRIVTPAFVNLVAKKISDHGFIHMATDWENYAQQMLEVLEASHDWQNVAGEHNFAERPTTRALTKFEQRGHRLGHATWDLIFQNFDTSRILK